MTSKAQTSGSVAVIGLGMMGRSIAACLLSAGHRVIGVTDNLEASVGAPERIHQLLADMVVEGLLDGPAEDLMQRFLMTGELKDIAGVEIVFESVTEDPKLKRALFKDFERVVSPNCILATNTSAIPISVL